jgi:hypothetical protein
MNIIKNVRDRFAEGVFNSAITKTNIEFECLFLFLYEPDFIEELLEEE